MVCGGTSQSTRTRARETDRNAGVVSFASPQRGTPSYRFGEINLLEWISSVLDDAIAVVD